MTQLQDIDAEIHKAKEAQVLRDATERLLANKDFQIVIDQGYFKDEAANLVMAMSAGLRPESVAIVQANIMGVGALKNFLTDIRSDGARADAAVDEFEEVRSQIMKEQLTAVEVN